MDAKVDYLSWTILGDVPRDPEQGRVAAVALMWQHAEPFAQWAETLQGWQDGSARGHYSASLFHPGTYTNVRFGGSANHILIEMPGTACQAARDAGVFEAILVTAQPRATRIDIAVDFPNGCSPAEFVGAGYNQRFASHASIISAEGSTEYVGSMKSERYARVYRYNPPHPRAGTLRVEHVLRGDYAKEVTAVLPVQGMPDIVARLGNTFGWLASAWKPDVVTDGKIRSKRADRHEPGRVRWLHKVVFPALVKAHQQGLIDLTEWYENALKLV